MTLFVQTTAGILTMACVYALIAFGWNVVYSVTGVLNLAQGEFFMIGGIVLATNSDRGLPVAIALALAAPFVVAILTESTLLRPLAKKGRIFNQVIVTLALAILLREVVHWAVGPDPLFAPSLISRGTVSFMGAFVPRQAVLLWVVTVVIGGALWLLFSRTTLGAAMRACAESPEGAAVVGLSTTRLRLVALGLAGLLGAIAGILLSSMTPVEFHSGTFVGVKGFVAATLGGLGVLRGAFLGSILLAALEGYFAGYVSSTYRDVFVLSVLIAVLLLKPEGLIGGGTGLRRRKRPRVRASSSADAAAHDTDSSPIASTVETPAPADQSATSAGG